MRTMVKSCKSTPIPLKISCDPNESSSLLGSQRNNTRGYSSGYLVKNPLPACWPPILLFSACHQQVYWVLVTELWQIHSFAPALFKSLTWKRAESIRSRRLTAKLHSLPPTLLSLEINGSRLRRNLSSLVCFLACLTWNNCWLLRGPLGDRRIPCYPRTGWHP